MQIKVAHFDKMGKEEKRKFESELIKKGFPSGYGERKALTTVQLKELLKG